MLDFTLYALEANFYLAFFALCYHFLFRRDHNFIANRLVIVGSIAFAWCIPAIDIAPSFSSAAAQIELSTFELNNYSTSLTPTYSFGTILASIYLCGILIGLVFLLIQIVHIVRSLSKRYQGNELGFHLFSSESKEAWSFFNIAFLGKHIPEENIDLIIAHERVHYEEGHSIDKLLAIAVKLLGWFNPASYYFHLAIEENHEFRADQVVCQVFNNHTTYSKVLVGQALGGVSHHLLSHQFSKKSMLKSRIQMINQTKQIGKMKYLLTIPLLATALFMHSCTKESAVEEITESKTIDMDDSSENVFKVVDKMPEFEGGQNALFQFMGENTIYPTEAKDENIEGTVFVEFVINEEGKVLQPNVLLAQSVDNDALHAAAVETISKMPNWVPGEQEGKKVKVKLILPIKFQLT